MHAVAGSIKADAEVEIYIVKVDGIRKVQQPAIVY